jgi:hypothetical protein
MVALKSGSEVGPRLAFSAQLAHLIVTQLDYRSVSADFQLVAL